MVSFSHFLNILILVGAIQGFITWILLRRLQSNKSANKILSWIILLISLACLNVYFLETVTSNIFIWNILEAIIPLVIIMPIGPLVYFYVKSILNPKFKIQKKHRPHFYSILLDLIPNFVVILYIIGGFFGLLPSENNYQLDDFIGTYNLYIDIPRWLSLVIYIWITLKLINTHNDIKNPTFVKWAKRFTIGFSIFSTIWIFHLIPYSIPSLSNQLLNIAGWYPVYIPLIILVYWLGINGYIISFKTYHKTSKNQILSKNTIHKTIAILEKIMTEERLFLKPTLKLNDIVQQSQISQKTISAVLNQHLGKSFNEYVNTFRVEEFKHRLLSENSENFTITGIALECGFNSQATFQRAFKAQTNQTPKEFRQAYLKN